MTEKGEYVPDTVLNVDIRDVVWTPLQVIATYRRPKNAGSYRELVYKAKKTKNIKTCPLQAQNCIE